MLRGFSVSFGRITERSAAEGDYADQGFALRNATLREAIEALTEAGGEQEGPPEANESPVTPSIRWISINYKVSEGPVIGETYSLHFPSYVSGSSRVRIARLLGCHGVPERSANPYFKKARPEGYADCLACGDVTFGAFLCEWCKLGALENNYSQDSITEADFDPGMLEVFRSSGEALAEQEQADHTAALFFAGYVEAALFSEMTEDDTPLDSLYDVTDLDSETAARMMRDCALFTIKAGELLTTAYERPNYSPAQAGRDFWFTRLHHGVGFWDREQLPEELGQKLTELAHTFTESGLYVEGGKIFQR